MPEILKPVIPENITVHLAAPDTPAENVTVNFVEYIKNGGVFGTGDGIILFDGEKVLTRDFPV